MSSVPAWLSSAGLDRHAEAFDGVSDSAFAGLLMQDFARFGVTEVDEKQRLYRLIKTLQQESQQQWCRGGGGAVGVGGASASSLAVEVDTTDAASAAAAAPSPTSLPQPPPQLRLSSPGGGQQQQAPLAGGKASAAALLSSFEIDVSMDGGGIGPATIAPLAPSPPVISTTKKEDDDGADDEDEAVEMESSVPPPLAEATTTTTTPPPTPSLPPRPPSPRIKVVVRKRPLNAAERQRGEADVLDADPSSKTVVVAEPRTRVDCSRYVDLQSFKFDAVLDESADGDDVYSAAVAPLVRSCCGGGMATVFAYGQTGSGKTFTMGKLPERAAADVLSTAAAWEEAGRGSGAGREGGTPCPPSAPLCSYGLWVSCFEIYGGKLFDLLNSRNKLDAREDSQGRVVIAGLRHARVRCARDVSAVALAAEGARSTGSTGANADSSRSHSVTQFSLYRLRKKKTDASGDDDRSTPSSSTAATRRKRAEEEAAERAEVEAEEACAAARAAVERAVASSASNSSTPSVAATMAALLQACLSSPAPPNTSSSSSPSTAALAAAARAASAAANAKTTPLPCPSLVGKLSFIDLAGSERGADVGDKAGASTRLEGAQINRSLLALKECIRALDSRSGSGGSGGGHVPFRGSKLTEVLRDSFVGSKSRTVMVATVAPGERSCEHTLNTLRYADRVKELRSGERGGGGEKGSGGARDDAAVDRQRQQRLARAARRASLNGLPPPSSEAEGSGSAPRSARPRRATEPPKLPLSSRRSSLAPPAFPAAATATAAAPADERPSRRSRVSIGTLGAAAAAGTRAALSLGGGVSRRVAPSTTTSLSPPPTRPPAPVDSSIRAAHRLSIERAMAGLKAEMGLLAALEGGGVGRGGDGLRGGSGARKSGGAASAPLRGQTQQQQKSFSDYVLELEAALDERAAAAAVVREELARWRRAAAAEEEEQE